MYLALVTGAALPAWGSHIGALADYVSGPDKFYNSGEIPVNTATALLPHLAGTLATHGAIQANPATRQHFNENLGNVYGAVGDRMRREEGSAETVRDFYNKRRKDQGLPIGSKTIPLEQAAKLRGGYRLAALASLLGTIGGAELAHRIRKDQPRPAESLLNAPESEDAPEVAKAKEIYEAMEAEKLAAAMGATA
tara:strand:+ start:1266 stop:1847 length:582 start_codon:yes stop_codon:yes gene_type:complete